MKSIMFHECYQFSVICESNFIIHSMQILFAHIIAVCYNIGIGHMKFL